MFRGSSFHTIDAKGRVVVPSRFRETIRSGEPANDRLMVSRLDGCLVGYRMKEWEALENKILLKAETDKNLRNFKRIFIGNASECVFDRQDRILIPPTLRNFAHLEKEIILVGVIDHFEIWARETWDEVNTQMKEDFQDTIVTLGL